MQQKEDPVENGVSNVTLDELIKAALTGQRYNQPRLGKQAWLYSQHLSKARAPDLPEDQHQDVFTQAFEELFRAGPGVLAHRSGKAAFRRAVLAAIRAVRASYAPPGQRTRPSGQLVRDRVHPEDIGRVIDPKTLEQSMSGEGADRAVDLDLIADPHAEDDVKVFEDGQEIDAVLALAPRQVALALRLIHLHGQPVEAVAADAGVSRFVLYRRIEAFCTGCRLAA